MRVRVTMFASGFVTATLAILLMLGALNFEWNSADAQDSGTWQAVAADRGSIDEVLGSIDSTCNVEATYDMYYENFLVMYACPED